MKKYKIGDKLKPKKGCEDECINYRENNGAYIVITDIEGNYYYDIYDKNNIKVEHCFYCFTDQDLEPYEDSKFKVGDRVRIIFAGIDTDLIGKIRRVTKVEGNRVWVEGSKSFWTDPQDLELIPGDKKQFIVHCPTEELWRKVQEKMFSEGYEWRSGEKYYDYWNKYKEQSCIFVGEYDVNEMVYKSRSFYEVEYPTIPIISATEYLGEEDKEKQMGATRREYMTQTYVDMMEAFSKSYIIDPYMLNPIKNSPAKEHKNPIMTGLKKVTNFIDSLQEPLKSYIRLGWVELVEDKYYVTNDGKQADAEIKFGLVKHKTLEAYAEAEVKRLEKEEKKK